MWILVSLFQLWYMEPQLENIKTAANGLQFMSESDYPLELVVLKSSAEGIENEIRSLSGKGTGDAVEKQDLDYFFRNHVKTFSPDNKEETDRAARFVQLVKTLRTNLTDIKVYRLGSVQVDAFIIGILKDGRYAGLRTKLIET
jgi:hypothetical protein